MKIKLVLTLFLCVSSISQGKSKRPAIITPYKNTLHSAVHKFKRSKPKKPYKNTLHSAVYKGDLKKVKAYIKKGADVNAKGRYEETPLHWVKDVEIARLLIKKGADVNAKNKYGKTTLLRQLLKRNYPVARLLIEKGADVNVRTAKEKKTPLHYVINVETVRLLIKNGADVNARDIFWFTPLDFVSFHASQNLKGPSIEEKKIIKFLKENGGKKTPCWVLLLVGLLVEIQSLIKEIKKKNDVLKYSDTSLFNQDFLKPVGRV